jgi:ABC-type multidrug transport system fused ATPase/permease subunit
MKRGFIVEENLINNLKETKTIIDKITALKKEKGRFYKSPFQSCFFMVIVFIVILVICNWLFGVLVPMFDKNILAWIEKAIISIVITIIIMYLLEKLIPKIRVLINKDKITVLEEQISSNFKILENISELPKNYWNSYAVDKIIEYFTNRRVENLKEALNLLDLDYKHKEKMEMLEHIDSHQF